MKKVSSFPYLLLSTICAFGLMTRLVGAQPLVSIQTVVVCDAGNTADTVTMTTDGTSGYGSVDYLFNIGRYEITIGQYAAFLNSVAKSDPYGLWNPLMGSDDNPNRGIARSGQSGSFIYSVIGPVGFTTAGASSPSDRPIQHVDWFDAARFANWLHNGATNGADTESGAYSLNGATNGVGVIRNTDAKWWIPSENEWYKAAYYKGGGTNAGYSLYPTKSDTAPGNTIGGASNQANYVDGDFSVTQSSGPIDNNQNYLTDVGAFSSSPGAYSTFDQGGNVWEWNEAVINGVWRGTRGGVWVDSAVSMQSSYRAAVAPDDGRPSVGFRVAKLFNPSGDEDGDGVTNYREVADGTNPNDASSFNPLSQGLVAYYPFNGNANDESGYGLDLTLSSSILAHDRFGAENSALLSQSSNGVVAESTKSIGISGNTDRTISMWIKGTSQANTSLGAGWGTPDQPGNASLLTANSDGSINFWGHHADVISDIPQAFSAYWHQVTLIYSGSLNETKILVDGAQRNITLGNQNTRSDLESITTTIKVAGWGFWATQNDAAIDDIRIYDRALNTNEVKQIYLIEGFNPDQTAFVVLNPEVFGHHSQNEYDLNRANGQTDVLTNPSAFNLFTQNEYESFGALEFSNGISSVISNPSAFNLFTPEEFDAHYNTGLSDGVSVVISNPSSYGLYTSNSIMDLRMGGLMIQRQGTYAVVSFQPQTTTDLTQPFTNNGTPITNTIPMPGNKGFLRINAKPIATPAPPQ